MNMKLIKSALIGVCVAAIGTLSLFGKSGDLSPQFKANQYLNNPTGEELYRANCARCHGDNGEGGKGPNLTTENKKAKWKDSDAKIVRQIEKGGFFMPSFRNKLSDTEIKSIAAYVRQLPPVSK